MDYGVSTVSLVTDASATTSIQIDKAYASIIETAKNQWLSEANGSIDKIPLIIHTDQHGYYKSSVLFDFINEIVSWYDVGKVINLGDTANSYGPSSTEDCVALDNYLEATKSVPFSKRIEIFGNHDTWGDKTELDATHHRITYISISVISMPEEQTTMETS